MCLCPATKIEELNTLAAQRPDNARFVAHASHARPPSGRRGGLTRIMTSTGARGPSSPLCIP
eukprot:scaffold686_cov342-Prasinococcus_capsulatus_cf.AAC.2